jgi:error-prone DNA polymerase
LRTNTEHNSPSQAENGSLSADLLGLAERDEAFRPSTGRGDEFAHGTPGSPDSREKAPPGVRPRDMFVPDLHIDDLKIKSRNFQ